MDAGKNDSFRVAIRKAIFAELIGDKMKLFIWNQPYGVKYGSACLYVVAETEEQARAMSASAPVAPFGLDPRPDTGTLGKIALGPPTRVLELPCAEVYHWEE
jgi:hypothetical protein